MQTKNLKMQKTNSNRGRRNRQRGQEGEREVANLLTESLGIEVKRLLGQERDMGADISTPPYRWEIKRRKRIGLVYDWMDEANASLKQGERPVVCFRADGKKWIVAIPIDEFIKLIREEIYGQPGTEANKSD